MRFRRDNLMKPSTFGVTNRRWWFTRSVVSSLPSVTTFIVGNEPNSNVYWLPPYDASGNDAAAAAYELLLAASYDAIKAIRPTATVVGGALDSRGPDDPTGMRQAHSPTTFIRDLGLAYRASGRTTPIMDVFDQHVYADNSSLPPSMPHAAGTTIAEGDYGKLVSLLAAAFDGTAQRGSNLPILYGEFGVETAIPSARAGAYSGVEPPSTGVVDEDTQPARGSRSTRAARSLLSDLSQQAPQRCPSRPSAGRRTGSRSTATTRSSRSPGVRAESL